MNALRRCGAWALRTLVLLPALMLGPDMTQAQSRASIDSAAWLAGCWSADGKEAGSGEQWMAPAGGTMLGVGRVVRGDQTLGFEFMQVRACANGSLVFIAAPSGQRETSFVLSRSEAGLLVFENPEHDFPQFVIYRLMSPNRLHARIEGQRSGALRGVDFPMTRVACGGPPAAPR